MKKNILLAITIVLLLAINSILSFKYKLVKDKNTEISYQLSEFSIKELRESEILKKSSIIQYLSEGMPANSIEVKDRKSLQLRPLSSFVENKSCLFLRFKETDCDACVLQCIQMLENISSQYPEVQIIVLSGYKNVRHFEAYAQNQKNNFPIYNVDYIPIAADHQDQPYFFILTPEQRIQNIFITRREESSFTKEYINSMQNKYWSQNMHSSHNCGVEDCGHNH